MSARMMLRFLLCSALSLFFSQGASAVSYYWQYSNVGNFSSKQSACDGWGASIVLSGSEAEKRFESIVSYSDPSYAYCKWGVYSSSGSRLGDKFVWLYRRGDSCPSNSTYNSQTGACDSSDPCVSKAGTSTPFSKSGIAPDAYMWISSDGKGSAAVQSGCFSGCVASTADQKCTTKTSGAYLCRGTAWFTGAQCGSGSDAPQEVSSSSTAEYPEPQTSTIDKPCVTTADSTGALVCQSEKTEEKEGQDCGTVNGKQVCVNSPPSKNGITIDSKTQTTTAADGSTTTTKTDTATTTTCDGVKSCKTSTTKSTTTTNKNSSGVTTSVSGSCSGAQCPSKNGNPDGDGDGFGDCVGDNCAVSGGTGEGDGTVSGESCDATLACAGDAIQCAILRQEKQHRCDQEAFQTVTPEEQQQMRTELDAEFAGDEFQPLTPGEDGTFDLSSMLDTSRQFSASCPSVPDWSFDLNGGQVTVQISEIISQLCEYLAWMGYVVVAFAMRAAAEIVAKGMT